MEQDELLARSGFAVLMAARAHLMVYEYEQDSDDILGQAAIRCARESRWYQRPVDYSVHWTVRPGPRVEAPTADFRATIVMENGKKYKIIHDCTENG